MATRRHTFGHVRDDWNYATKTTVFFGLFTVIAVFGWLVSTLLTAIHLFALPAIPPDAAVQGSIAVITSPWAYVGPIPLATLGAVYYLSTIGVAVWWFDTRHPAIVKLLTPITAMGVIASAYFVWLQLVPIGAICPFCMMSAGATVVLFGLELAILRNSPTLPISDALGQLVPLVRASTLWLIFVPVLVGMATLAGMFLIPMLPLPEPVPFA